MLLRVWFASLITFCAFGIGLAGLAQETGVQPNPIKVKEDLSLNETILARQFAAFEDSLLRLKQRLERSSSQDDRDRAAVLEKVLEQSKNASISVQFEQMVEFLKTQKFSNVGDIKLAAERSVKIADDLRDLLALLREDPRLNQRREEQKRIEELLKELGRIIEIQKMVQGQTDLGKTDPKELKQNQVKVSNATDNLAKKMAPKPTESKDGKGDGKAGKDGKGDAKDAGKAADGKAGESKGDGGEGKGGEGEAGKGEGKGGEGGGQAQAKGDGGEEGKQPAQKGDKAPDNASDPVASSKKQVEDAHYDQKSSENKIGKKDNKAASDDQGEAITKLEAARKKLEDLLRQLREEELERLLAALLGRCEKMLAMQIAVLGGTEDVDRAIRSSLDKLPTRDNKMYGLKLSDQEKEIVGEATKAIELLEAEGSGVAFPEVFMQVREDMKHIQRRLEITDAGPVTQAIEHDVIDTLKEMIEALKKAKQDLDNKKNPPSPPPPGGGPPPDQKLLELIAELKMIRSLQLRVNSRTEVYGKMYEGKEGEQTSDPNIVRELDNLSQRQERIYEITTKLAKGDNK